MAGLTIPGTGWEACEAATANPVISRTAAASNSGMNARISALV
jgi:hypothetical protein